MKNDPKTFLEAIKHFADPDVTHNLIPALAGWCELPDLRPHRRPVHQHAPHVGMQRKASQAAIFVESGHYLRG
jgi:hypothetical protein